MAPKNEPSKKSQDKVKAKIIEDKTFGLKNKNKSSKVNQYIKQVEAQVKGAGNAKKVKQDEMDAKLQKEKKAAEEAKKAELAALFKPAVQAQKVPPGVDPKTVLCVYFKSGACLKGDKCKFSHDLAVERKSAKIDMYQDQRQLSKEEDSMDNWDTNKLNEVVSKKHGPGIKTTTELVCNNFLDAIEQRKYGWFWECPNGPSCKYRHALPPNFVLKRKDDKNALEDKEEISLEDFLETERHSIEKKTAVTAESFAKWKLDRKVKQEAEERAAAKKRETEIRSGRINQMSGRDLFTYQPDLFLGGDDDEAMDVDYTQREEDQEEEKPTIDASVFLDASLENLEIEDD